MDARKPRQPLIEQPTVPRARRTHFVSYRSLLLRNAAVWKRQSHVWFSTAGENPQQHRLSCVSGSEARQLAMTMTTELRKARSDDEYNQTIMRLLAEIRSAWPDNVKVRHVHACDASVKGTVNSAGQCACGFDWTPHQLTTDCPCIVEIDSSDASGEWQFVVHRRYAKKEMVTV